MVDLSGSVVAERYLISRQIASGGMATVYLAKDLRLDRPVALKIVHSHLSNDEDFREKFIQEAKISARLSHANLVNVFDQGQDQDQIYLAMEYVPGITLRDALKDLGTLSPDQALELYEQLLAGLSAAHQAGILHRDLKPENVLLADDGRIKLADFGLARKISDQTQAANLVGTVAYLSPELVTNGLVDARSDVYAAGVMLFELITGQQPFQGEQALQVAVQHANASVPAPSSIKSDIPELMDDLVLWATERDPDLRPANAGELLDAVRNIRRQLASTPIRQNSTAILEPIDLGPATTPATTVLPSGFADDIEAASTNNSEYSNATQVLGLLPVAAASHDTQVLGRAGLESSSQTPDVTRSDSRFRIGAFLLASFLTVLVGLGAGWAFGSGPLAPFQIPSTSGLTEEQSLKLLANCRCSIETVEKHSTSIPVGQAIETNPPAGSVIWGSPIALSISKGAKLISAPKLQGLNVAEATAEVLKTGFKLGKITSWFNQAPIGTVYEFQGSDGLKIPENSTLDLKISLGSLPVLSNIDEALATTALQAAGLEVSQVTLAPSETVAIGKVINFVPLTDPIGAGGEVELIVSSGPSN